MTAAFTMTNVAVGYAGGGGAGGPGDQVFFQCFNASNGPNPPHVLNVNDQFTDPTDQKVGKLKMICSFNPDVLPVSDNDLRAAEARPTIVTCYESHGAKTKSNILYTDTFFGEPQTAKVNGQAQLICVLGDDGTPRE